MSKSKSKCASWLRSFRTYSANDLFYYYILLLFLSVQQSKVTLPVVSLIQMYLYSTKPQQKLSLDTWMKRLGLQLQVLTCQFIFSPLGDSNHSDDSWKLKRWNKMTWIKKQCVRVITDNQSNLLFNALKVWYVRFRGLYLQNMASLVYNNIDIKSIIINTQKSLTRSGWCFVGFSCGRISTVVQCARIK